MNADERSKETIEKEGSGSIQADSDAPSPAEERRTAGDGTLQQDGPTPAEETAQHDASAAGEDTPERDGLAHAEIEKKKLHKLLSSLDLKHFTQDELHEIINAALYFKIDESVQQELVRLVRLVRRLMEQSLSMPRETDDDKEKKKYIDKCLSWAGLTIGALLKPEPDMVVARGLMTSIETELLMQSKIKWIKCIVRIFALNQMIPFAFGVLCSALVAGVLGGPLLYLIQTNDQFMFVKITVIFAFFGGITSLIVRLPSVIALQDQNVLTVFWTAFFKPFVGMLFAIVIYFMMKSGVVQLVNDTVSDEPYFWGMLGFIAGWSERFASDIIDRAAERIPSGTANPRPGIGWGSEDERI